MWKREGRFVSVEVSAKADGKEVDLSKWTVRVLMVLGALFVLVTGVTFQHRNPQMPIWAVVGATVITVAGMLFVMRVMFGGSKKGRLYRFITIGVGPVLLWGAYDEWNTHNRMNFLAWFFLAVGLHAVYTEILKPAVRRLRQTSS